MINVELYRDHGHPWDRRAGFDLMTIDADSKEELTRAVAEAESKFWAAWLIGEHAPTGRPAGVFYKPCDIAVPWEDGPKQQHPGNPRGCSTTGCRVFDEEVMATGMNAAIALSR